MLGSNGLISGRATDHSDLFVKASNEISRVYMYHLVMTNIAMERSTMFKNGKPSISMGHLYHGYVK